jgi:hypothetical protein
MRMDTRRLEASAVNAVVSSAGSRGHRFRSRAGTPRTATGDELGIKVGHDRGVLGLQFGALLRCRVKVEVFLEVVLGLLAYRHPFRVGALRAGKRADVSADGGAVLGGQLD